MTHSLRDALKATQCLKWTKPAPNDRHIGGADAPEVVLIGRVMSTVLGGGPELTVDSTIFEMWLGSP